MQMFHQNNCRELTSALELDLHNSSHSIPLAGHALVLHRRCNLCIPSSLMVGGAVGMLDALLIS